MNYTLEQLVSDKELRKSLVEGVFSFTDDEGDFFAVDFENESMRQNHITIFEVLYSLGGDELFEKILKEGNTCLANTPDAAKVGVKEIAGAKGWYLKTNASAFAAFSSIIYGLSALENPERFSFSVEEESTVYRLVSKSANGYVVDICYGYDGIYKVEKREDGSFVVVHIEDGKEISFVVTGFSGTTEINSFKILEPISIDVEEYDEETDLYEQKYKPIAYKYKLTENGKWGFFNVNFSQFIPPLFDDVLITVGDNGGKIIAYEKIENWNVNMYDAVETSKKDNCYLYFSDSDFFDSSDMKINISYTGCISETFIPNENSIFDKINLSKEDKEIVFYSPAGSTRDGFVFVKEKASMTGFGFARTSINAMAVKVVDNTIKGEKTKKVLAVAENSTITIYDYAKLYSEEESCYRAVRQLYKDFYVVERDGYLGIAKMHKLNSEAFYIKEHILELDEMITPYAFTEIKMAAQECVIVDRFGKKGMFRINDKKYIIPCDYDELVPMGWNKYKVSKADFNGIIEVITEPKWIEKLQRAK